MYVLSVNFKNLKKYRTLLGFTQLQVASALGIDRSTYSYYESGKHEPDIRTIQKLMRVFKIDYKDILTSDQDGELLLSDSLNNMTNACNISQNSEIDSLESIDTSLSDDERKLVLIYRALDKKNKRKLLRSSLRLARNYKY